MSISVLAKVSRADVRAEPFPHVVVENCLPQSEYDALARSYPEDALIIELDHWRRKGPVLQNQRNEISAWDAARHGERLSPSWRSFIEYHTSQAFLDEVIELLAPDIRAAYPQLEARLNKSLHELTAGVRYDPHRDTGDVSLDCQPGINTPVTRSSSVRRVHTDAPHKLFAALFYFRSEDDDSTGGDLEIYRWKSDSRRRFNGKEIDEGDARHVSTIPYRANTLVLFVNSDLALHAVSERSITPHTRRLVNFVGEVYRCVPEGLFVKHQKPWAQARRLIEKKVRKLTKRF